MWLQRDLICITFNLVAFSIFRCFGSLGYGIKSMLWPTASSRVQWKYSERFHHSLLSWLQALPKPAWLFFVFLNTKYRLKLYYLYACRAKDAPLFESKCSSSPVLIQESKWSPNQIKLIPGSLVPIPAWRLEKYTHFIQHKHGEKNQEWGAGLLVKEIV